MDQETQSKKRKADVEMDVDYRVCLLRPPYRTPVRRVRCSAGHGHGGGLLLDVLLKDRVGNPQSAESIVQSFQEQTPEGMTTFNQTKSCRHRSPTCLRLLHSDACELSVTTYDTQRRGYWPTHFAGILVAYLCTTCAVRGEQPTLHLGIYICVGFWPMHSKAAAHPPLGRVAGEYESSTESLPLNSVPCSCRASKPQPKLGKNPNGDRRLL